MEGLLNKEYNQMQEEGEEQKWAGWDGVDQAIKTETQSAKGCNRLEHSG